MPIIRPTNPAARLYLILEKARERNGQASIGDVWAFVLDTPKGGKLWARVGLVYSLPGEIKKQLQHRLEYDPHEMSWWEALSFALTNYGAREAWHYVSSGITDDILGRIRINARTLNLVAKETVVPQATIDDLLDHIRTIRERMEDESDVDEDLAHFLDQRLEYMEDLLGDIPIIGALSIKPKIEKVVNEVETVSEDLRSTVTPATWEWWERILGRTRTVFATVGIVAGSLVTTTGAVKELMPSAPQLDHTQWGKEQMSKELPSRIREPVQEEDEGDENTPVDADFKEV